MRHVATTDIQARHFSLAFENLPFYHFRTCRTLRMAITFVTVVACHHNRFWESRCNRNNVPTISLKPVHFLSDFGIPFRHMTQVLSRHTSSLTSDYPSYFELFLTYLLQNLHILANPYQNKPFQASSTKYTKSKPKCPDVFDYAKL